MVRDFVKGVLWGGVTAVAGLAVISQGTLAPRPESRPEPVAEASEAVAPTQEPLSGEAVTAPSDLAEAPEVETSETEVAETEAADAETPALEDAPVPATTASDAPAALAGGVQMPDEPLLRPMAGADAPPPALVVPDLQAPVASAEAPKTDVVPPEPAPSEPVQSETARPEPAAPDPGPSAEAAIVAEAQPEVSPETGAEADVPVLPQEDPAPGLGQAGDAPTLAPAAKLAPDAGLAGKAVDGVKTGRLPTITAGAEPPVAEAETAPAVDLPPIARFARAFDNPQGKPLFAILMIDPGTADVPRADLAALPFPVSFVIDPMAPGASDAAAIYRAAGQEVVMLATAIPKGAKASDLEQSFAGLQDKLPEAVALIDTADAIFQDNRGLAAEVVTILAEQGRGLVTFDRGLNAADQVARREGLPAATIFRSLDDDGEDAPLIRRYLDRAAFKAAQEGRVVVIGTARTPTIAALMEWAVEGRAASVALAPITAVMGAD